MILARQIHDDLVREPRESVVMSGQGLDEKISALVNQERLLRYLHTPVRKTGTGDVVTGPVGTGALGEIGFGAGLPGADNGSAFMRPLTAGGLRPVAVPHSKLFERPHGLQASVGALGSNDLHATEHGDNQWPNPGSHTPDKMRFVEEEQSWVR